VLRQDGRAMPCCHEMQSRKRERDWKGQKLKQLQNRHLPETSNKKRDFPSAFRYGLEFGRKQMN